MRPIRRIIPEQQRAPKDERPVMDQRRGILLVRLKSIGDIVFTLPAVHALRARFPEEPISFLISKEYSELLEGFQDVNSTIELDRERFRALHPFHILMEGRSLLQRVRQERFRLAIDLQGYGETAWLTRACGAPERWGTFYTSGRKWAYTRAVARDGTLHPANDHLVLLHNNGVSSAQVRNQFVPPRQAMVEAGNLLFGCGLSSSKPLLFIQPITSSMKKNWPMASYLEVARHWKTRGLQVLFGGGPGDRQELEPAKEAGFPVAAGCTLLVSAGLANLSTLTLGGDTGLVHLATAMGKRVVMIMRSNRAGSTHPFQHADWAVCPPAKGPIHSISIQEVNEHCARAWSELGFEI